MAEVKETLNAALAKIAFLVDSLGAKTSRSEEGEAGMLAVPGEVEGSLCDAVEAL